MTQQWYCYILRNTKEEYKNLTYNGSTNNIWRRLRQHNEEISGGAKYTKHRGQSWEVYILLTGFLNHNNALSCEWKIKHPTNVKQRPKKYCGPIGRAISLNIVLPLEKWTSKCNIDNSKCQYTLYIVDDMYHHLDMSLVPYNITIISVPSIIQEHIK